MHVCNCVTCVYLQRHREMSSLSDCDDDGDDDDDADADGLHFQLDSDADDEFECDCPVCLMHQQHISGISGMLVLAYDEGSLAELCVLCCEYYCMAYVM